MPDAINTLFMKVLYFFFAVCITFLSCTKDKTTYTIAGQIYQGCTTTPYANKEISFFQSIGGFFTTSGGNIGTMATDANGRFSFTYTPKNDGNIKIQAPAGFGFSNILIGVPGKKNHSNLVINYGARTVVQVALNVSKTYTVNDTLYITDFRNFTNFLKITGPFVNQILYNAPSYGYENIYNNGNQATVGYRINSTGAWSTKEFKLIDCDTSRVTVDIN